MRRIPSRTFPKGALAKAHALSAFACLSVPIKLSWTATFAQRPPVAVAGVMPLRPLPASTFPETVAEIDAPEAAPVVSRRIPLSPLPRDSFWLFVSYVVRPVESVPMKLSVIWPICWVPPKSAMTSTPLRLFREMRLPVTKFLTAAGVPALPMSSRTPSFRLPVMYRRGPADSPIAGRSTDSWPQQLRPCCSRSP